MSPLFSTYAIVVGYTTTATVHNLFTIIFIISIDKCVGIWYNKIENKSKEILLWKKLVLTMEEEKTPIA